MAAEFRLLGPLEVLRDGRPVPLRAAKQRALLADLLLCRGRVVSVDRLVEDLWHESPPEGARHALEAHASRLRSALGDAAALVARAPGYVLEVEPLAVDVVCFEQLLAGAREAQAADPARAAAEAERGLALWRGPALSDFAFEPFAQAEIARLEELRWEALHLRIDAELALGSADLVAELEALVAAEPFRERLCAQLMLALYRAGRQADALAAYRDARERLVEGLGLEPGEELRALEASILRQEAALALSAPAPPTPRRTLATVLAAVLPDAERLALSLDPETLRGAIGGFADAASEAVARHGGTAVASRPGELTAVFGAPLAHEDDALRALRAAVEIRDAGTDPAPRVALATGEVLTGAAGGGPAVTGPAAVVADRLCRETAAGAIAADELTRQLTAGTARFADLGTLDLEGLPRPLPTFRLESLVDRAPAIARRLDGPLVGRRQELAALHGAFATAVRRGSLEPVAVLGPPGIGKTRLVLELVAGVAEQATVLLGRCPAYGEAGALAPLGEAFGSREEVAAALAGEPEGEAIAACLEAVFTTETTVPAEEVPWAARRYCETLAARRPLVLVLDDLHWAGPELLDLVEQLATSSRDAAILLVGVAREELADDRPRFLRTGERLLLDPLSDGETATLADHLLSQYALDARTRDRLVTAAEGNPLFLEQLVAHVAESGVLELPPTVRSLLAARLDRLGPGERAVLERAAVVGREFAPDEVAALLDDAAAPTVATHLAGLVRRGFLQAPRNGRHGFRHWLVHDAAYRAAPKDLRAELHERLADLLAHRGAEDELVGHHLEQAYRLRTELAPPDAHTSRLAEDAGRLLGSAGMRVWKRSEAAAASKLLGRATELLPAEDELRLDLLCELGIALNSAGETEHAAETLLEAVEAATRADDRRVELRARIELAAAHLLDQRGTSAKELFDLAERALPVFESLGDHRALGRTWMLTGWVHGGMYCRNAVWELSAEQALKHYRAAGFPTVTCVGHTAAALYFGPTPAARGIARCRELLEHDVDDLSGEANVLAHLAGLEAMSAAFDEAFEIGARARSIYEDLGRPIAVARTCAPIEAGAARLAGDTARAARLLTESCEALRDMRNWAPLSTQAAQLADALLELGATDGAERWTVVAETNASPDDTSAQLSWRTARARLLARAGDVEPAERLVAEALALAGATDALNQRAGVELAHADVLTAAGKDAEAAAARSEALDLLDRKGNVAAAARLRTGQRAATYS